ncbi:hypothetical protein E4631_04390 [Hymenobacter sp. UV11]|uniref:hypothetical protein n=1 Tax=Hymenobacter sp. UV11 TaxID=1849735 RepID=UPI00105DF9F1|nr:hypothetical protein [Hymenobacter sp. UV11]TDN35953.1 hypothetical protein A8B98_11095 [Hymenobacter sp. UV11]TFZ68233.1 hypothetical protein E4631_04390 [Hymenobacter sp. UV11]
MKNILFVALLAGASAVEAAPLTLPATLPLTIKQTPQEQAPMSKAELKRRRKLRKQNGPEVYKGSVAEQNRIITDAAGSQKDDGEEVTTKTKKSKKNQ